MKKYENKSLQAMPNIHAKYRVTGLSLFLTQLCNKFMILTIRNF